jgi:hypothetical protein
LASDVPVKDLRPLAEWRDELGLDRLRANLIDGDLDAWWYDHATGEFHQIPRTHWQKENVQLAIAWGWFIGGGLFSRDNRWCVIHAARRVKHAGGRKPGQETGKTLIMAAARNILDDEAAQRPPRGHGRLTRLTELVKKTPAGKQYALNTIEGYIRPVLREWEEKNPGK